MNIKKLSDDALYEFLYQSGVDEPDIPRKRQARIKLGRNRSGQFREVKR